MNHGGKHFEFSGTSLCRDMVPGLCTEYPSNHVKLISLGSTKTTLLCQNYQRTKGWYCSSGMRMAALLMRAINHPSRARQQPTRIARLHVYAHALSANLTIKSHR